MATFPPLHSDSSRQMDHNVQCFTGNSIPVDSQQLDIATWIFLVSYHAQSASFEDRNSLMELAQHLPTADLSNPEVQSVIEAVKALDKKLYDPTLSPKSLQALTSISKKLTHKPASAKKLFE